jgi:hypothetical protein
MGVWRLLRGLLARLRLGFTESEREPELRFVLYMNYGMIPMGVHVTPSVVSSYPWVYKPPPTFRVFFLHHSSTFGKHQK